MYRQVNSRQEYEELKNEDIKTEMKIEIFKLQILMMKKFLELKQEIYETYRWLLYKEN